MANRLRLHTLESTSKARSGHPTICLSAAEIMSVLFFKVMGFDPKNLDALDNDEFELSKGHSATILYAALEESGVFLTEQLS